MARCIVLVCVLLGLVLVADGTYRRTYPRSQRTRGGQTRTEEKTHDSAATVLDPDRFLVKYGYLGQPPDGVQHSPGARNEAIKNFQRMAGLKVTGRLDRATRRKMLAPRCGNPDVIPQGTVAAEPNHGKGPANYYAPGYKWKKNQLSWRLLNYSPDMDSGLQRLAIDNAFKYWSQVAPLDFNELGGGKADIEMKFGHGEHGDGAGNAFDGRGGVLAHAFYPEDGSTHFDEAERWSWRGEEDSTNLEIVAAHELGHALGLGHTNVRGALMAPYYQGYDPNFKLHEDDILAIRSLYGRREAVPTEAPPRTPQPPSTTRPTPTPTIKPSYKPDTCTTKFDAILQGHDSRIYVFRGQWVWRLNDWAVDPGYPLQASDVYDRPPSNIGAAVYSWGTRFTYFFKGRVIYKYYGFRRIERRVMTRSGGPSRPQAAFMSSDGQIYVLQGSQYWQFDEYAMEMTGQPASISSRWPGVPRHTEAAVRLRDGYLYLIKGAKYRKYDEYRRTVLPGYPRPKAGPFMGPVCGGRYVPK